MAVFVQKRGHVIGGVVTSWVVSLNSVYSSSFPAFLNSRLEYFTNNAQNATIYPENALKTSPDSPQKIHKDLGFLRHSVSTAFSYHRHFPMLWMSFSSTPDVVNPKERGYARANLQAAKTLSSSDLLALPATQQIQSTT